MSIKYLLFVGIFLGIARHVYAVDLTLKPGETSDDTIDATIRRIREKCILAKDYYFLRRLAEAQTKSIAATTGGIWRRHLLSSCVLLLRLEWNKRNKSTVIKNRNKQAKNEYIIRGHKVNAKRGDSQEPLPHEDFCFQSNSVVLATGTTDLPNRLGTTGENLPYVVHSLKPFEQMITKKEIASDSDPVVVVGAGLSAADAILMALENNISVAHVFRVSPNDSSLVFKKLPLSMYHEYHRVYSLMKGKEVNDLYKPYSRHQVEELQKDNKVLIKCLKNSYNISTLNTSLAVVLIGAKPNLAFLPQEGKYLGTIVNQSIDSKHNPIQVDPFSYEAIKEPGMYAMGPLMGDNFVRFAIGGSLGITNHLIMKAQGK
uniref:FAD/NAD(P)-binding domain-containing protein n=1 Tax=Octopus bimaculoides TaxID=37653 RepID=A0A0L8G1V6_OCTBM